MITNFGLITERFFWIKERKNFFKIFVKAESFSGIQIVLLHTERRYISFYCPERLRELHVSLFSETFFVYSCIKKSKQNKHVNWELRSQNIASKKFDHHIKSFVNEFEITICYIKEVLLLLASQVDSFIPAQWKIAIQNLEEMTLQNIFALMQTWWHLTKQMKINQIFQSPRNRLMLLIWRVP